MSALMATTPPVQKKKCSARLSHSIGVLRVIGSRVLGLFITLLLSSMVVFGALLIAPGSPLTFLTQGRSTSPEAIAALEKQYHLDESIPAQYWHWLSGVVQGDFGNSILYKDSVASLVAERAMNTVVLVACAAVLIIVVGLVLGVITGLRPGRLSSLAMVVATGAMAVPAFVAAVVLTLVFAVQLGWLPAFGPGDGFRGRIEHMILPAVALALSSVAFVARLTQTAVREELTSEHVQTATSRGLPRRTVIGRHVLRNAAIPILTVAGLTVAGLIAASVIVEQAFQLNGLGSFLVTAVQQKDFPVVQAICLLYVAAFIVLNTLIDVAYSLLDPRIAMNGGRP